MGPRPDVRRPAPPPARLGHDDRGGFQQGTADALWRYAPLIRDFGPEAIVVVSADAVYTLDYGVLVEEHAESGAGVTMVTTEVDAGDASRYGVVQVTDGRVREYVYKPDEPQGNVVSNEIFAFRPEPLLDTLDALGDAAGEEGLEDLGDELLPRLVDDGAAREHRFDGYWRDVGTVPAYWEAHQDLLADEPPIDFDDPAWPLLTRGATERAPARVLASADVAQSLLGPASRVAGRVERSVLGRAAIVEPGAVVRDSVLLNGAVVRRGARVERAVLDDRVEIGEDAEVGEAGGEIALVGMRARVDSGARLGGGARWPEVEED